MTYRLAEYKVLERLAASQTTAHSLDDRACRYIYSLATKADLADMNAEEQAFYDWLGTDQPFYATYLPAQDLSQNEGKRDG